ncbi:hypothetical protein T484DRAFT_1855628 [Baffinella frigidus]|nr:hypothetical protein T484DRAFT_1855628 [Cryptophyta sp. CCMP2293]
MTHCFAERRLVSVILLVLLFSAAVLVEDCEAAKKKKKSKAKKPEPEPEAEGDDEGEAPVDATTGKKKAMKDFTKADWDRLEREAEGPGEPFKMPEPPNVEFDPKNPQAFMAAQKKGKPAMMFASLNLIKDATTGEMRSRNKEETEEVAFRHKSLMQTSHPYIQKQ